MCCTGSAVFPGVINILTLFFILRVLAPGRPTAPHSTTPPKHTVNHPFRTQDVSWEKQNEGDSEC